jgi:hypothetical protein
MYVAGHLDAAHIKVPETANHMQQATSGTGQQPAAGKEASHDEKKMAENHHGDEMKQQQHHQDASTQPQLVVHQAPAAVHTASAGHTAAWSSQAPASLEHAAKQERHEASSMRAVQVHGSKPIATQSQPPTAHASAAVSEGVRKATSDMAGAEAKAHEDSNNKRMEGHADNAATKRAQPVLVHAESKANQAASADGKTSAKNIKAEGKTQGNKDVKMAADKVTVPAVKEIDPLHIIDKALTVFSFV